MKKMFSAVMIMVLGIICTAIPGFAKSNSAQQIQTVVMTGSEVSDTLKNRIKQSGVNITNESTIQLVPISSNQETQNKALVITNKVGTSITKDVLMMVTDEGVGFEQGSDVSTRAGSTVEFPPLSWDGRYVIRGTAVYNEYGSYYQPIGAYFIYQKYEDCTVSNIEMLYICDGFEYSYPEFEPLGDSEIEYVIAVEKASPKESNMYSTTKEYSTNRVINTSSGSPSVGQFLTFNVVVDGKSDGYTVKL